eukprot:scaffold32640_cov101-Isochrysis_galbana.AAC.3
MSGLSARHASRPWRPRAGAFQLAAVAPSLALFPGSSVLPHRHTVDVVGWVIVASPSLCTSVTVIGLSLAAPKESMEMEKTADATRISRDLHRVVLRCRLLLSFPHHRPPLRPSVTVEGPRDTRWVLFLVCLWDPVKNQAAAQL